MLRSMRGLGVAAVGTVSTVIVMFLAAWDARGKAAKAYREAVKNLFRSPAALAMVTLNLVAALTLPILTKLDRRDEHQVQATRRGLKFYALRRNYHGRHHATGTYALAA